MRVYMRAFHMVSNFRRDRMSRRKMALAFDTGKSILKIGSREAILSLIDWYTFQPKLEEINNGRK